MDYAELFDLKTIVAAIVGFVVFVIEESIINIIEGVGSDMILWSADYVEQSGYQYGVLCAFLMRLIPAAIAGAGAYAFFANRNL